MQDEKGSYIQSVLSVFGLGVSLVTTILPILSIDAVTSLFLDKTISRAVSFVAVILGLAVTWFILKYCEFINIPLGRKKERGRGYPEPWTRLESRGTIVILILAALVCAVAFFAITQAHLATDVSYYSIVSTVQAFLYMAFFITIIAIFSILFTSTRAQYQREDEIDRLPAALFATLKRYGLVKPGIEVYMDKTLSREEAINEGITSFGPLRKIKIRTNPQEVEVIEFIATYDGKQIIQVLKKQKE